MMQIYFEGNYDNVISKLGDKPFCIFGNTMYANIFYLYCEEKNIAQNIKAFILSNLDKDTRKSHILHGIPVRGMDWLNDAEITYDIFMAAKVKTIQEQLIPCLKNARCGNLFYVSEFVHSAMYSRYVYRYCENIIKRCMTYLNPYMRGVISISDFESENTYKYLLRIAAGDCPDPNIFQSDESLDEIHQNQLGDYRYIKEIKKENLDQYKCVIYQVRSHYDHKLKEDFFTPFIVEIQVGAALTDIDIAECKDNMGDNISLRNRDYCEMSAVYWVWKNDIDSDYIGFCHYRRRFVINEEMVNRIIVDDYDAVYTIPLLRDGGIRKEFVERNYYLTPEIWEMVGKIVKKVSEDDYKYWLKLEKSYFIIPCNMFIMKKKIFHAYCSWIFMILNEIDNHYLNQGIQWNNRYLGYIAECLTTLYVMKNKDTLKKGYVEMKLLESE